MNLPSIRNLDVRGKRVLVRADFDIELTQKHLAHDIRMRANMDTINYILRKGGSVRIITHNGRPNGKYEKNMSLKPLIGHLERMTKKSVSFIPDPFERSAFNAHHDSGDILLFENIRFWPGEEANSSLFARKIAAWGDIYVNEAFANCHRRHASVAALARKLPSYAGFHLEREIMVLARLLRAPPRPFIAVLGGAKLETKLPLIRRFLKTAEYVLIGGALANTMFALRGMETGKSVIAKEEKHTKRLRELRNRKLILPIDVVASRALHKGALYRVCKPQDIKKDEYIVDIGPETLNFFMEKIKNAKSLVWNGPLGCYEIPEFAHGTHAFARRLKSLAALKVVGGGNSLATLAEHNLLSSFTHVSTGGGAMLEFLSGKKLPGIEALKR